MFAINSKDDVQRYKGTPTYDSFLKQIKSRYEYQKNVAEYPENYYLENGERNPDVADIEPVYITDYKDGLLTKYGISKSEIGY